MQLDNSGSASHKWNRILFRAYWYVLVFYFVVTSINLFVNVVVLKTNDWYFVETTIREALLLGTGRGLLTLLVAHFLYRRVTKYADYIVISSGFILSTALAGSSGAIENIHTLLFIPLLGATIYFERRRTIFACLCFGLSMIYLLLAFPRYFMYMETIDYLPTLAISGAGCLIAYGIYKRSLEAVDQMREQTTVQEGLLAKKNAAERLAFYDTLTGIYNHKSFQEHLENYIKESRYKGILLHLALIDIDFFKSVNDTYGHWAGDGVLRTFGRILREQLPNEAIPARYGGEEFAVIFVGLRDEEVLSALENVRQLMEKTEHPELSGRNVTISIGLRGFLEAEDTKETLFVKADDALYKAKRTGRNKICVE
jgi:diguanylate cyclase (GGDEF)-like protein